MLEGAGLISRGKDAQYRPCKLEAGPLSDVDGWLESYRRFWEESLDQLEVYLAELQKGDPDGTNELRWSTTSSRSGRSAPPSTRPGSPPISGSGPRASTDSPPTSNN